MVCWESTILSNFLRYLGLLLTHLWSEEVTFHLIWIFKLNVNIFLQYSENIDMFIIQWLADYLLFNYLPYLKISDNL